MAKGKFELMNPIQGSVMLVMLNPSMGGGLLVLNRGTQKINSKGSRFDKLGPATQTDLKKVYDNGPEFASVVKAPAGYLAPWEKIGVASEEE